MRSTTARNFLHRAWCAVLGTARAASCSLGITFAAAVGLSAGLVAAPAAAYAQQGDSDMIVLRNGTKLYGKIVSETATSIKFRGQIAGIELETEYQKSDLTEIQRGVVNPNAAASAPGATAGSPPSTSPAAIPDDGRQRVYFIDLVGFLGEEISETPFLTALRDANAKGADHVIITLDAKRERNMFEKIDDDTWEIGEFDRGVKIAEALAVTMPREWKKTPKIHIWVKGAMGGAAFIPWVVPNMYFHSEGKIGGVGDLSFIGAGADEVVRQKWQSARLAMAQGWARYGGYDERFITAMTRLEYVLSFKNENGRIVLLERMPQGPDEELLTDSGLGEYTDTTAERARNLGNDVLTLNARLAQILGISKGTAETREQLLAIAQVESNFVDVSDRSERIMNDWSRGLDRAKRSLVKNRDDLQELMPRRTQGEEAEQARTRGRCIRILEEMKTTINRWDEALTMQWRGQNGIPPIPQIDQMLEMLRLEAIAARQR